MEKCNPLVRSQQDKNDNQPYKSARKSCKYLIYKIGTSSAQSKTTCDLPSLRIQTDTLFHRIEGKNDNRIWGMHVAQCADKFKTTHIHASALPGMKSAVLASGPRFNIKMSSYQYRKSHYGDKTVTRSSYLHNGNSYTAKMSSLYWIGALVTNAMELLQSSTKPSIYTPRGQQHHLYLISPRARINITRGTWLCKPFRGLFSLRRYRLIGKGILIINLRRSYIHI